MVSLSLYQRHKIIESKVMFEMKVRKVKFYRFSRIYTWVAGQLNKQELNHALMRLERDEKIETMCRSGRKYYKVNGQYTV